MREIKFRGKRIDNGEWVYGYYFIEERDIEDGIIWRDIPQIQQRYGDHFQYFDVDLATVGQYTGLKDKNGKEIYEGDIVEAKDPYKYNSKEIFYTCEVVFTEGAAFMLKHTYENWGTVGIRYFGLRDMELEVIGNIYENPELLEGDGEE